MPKLAPYRLTWSALTESYEICTTRDNEVLPVDIGGPDWFRWLACTSCFLFTGKQGGYTARKETRQRGDQYWYAYASHAPGQRLQKKYLGKTADLTLARLESIANALNAEGPGNETARPDAGSAPHAAAPETPVPTRHTPAVPVPPADGESTLPQNQREVHPLLATKLQAPRLRSRLVARPLLLKQLHLGVTGPLTLLSAPAGFGKTTLLAQWLQHSRMPVAWLSLEPEDNDPTRFLTHLIAALQTIDARLGATALLALETIQPSAPELVLASLVNELLAREGGELALVLDDYHVITSPTLQHGLAYLLEHLPACLHLLLATREDPLLPLARLRARGQLIEVRAAELRFDAQEIRAFLREVMDLDLEAEAIATLEQRTEGWIAGLQLATLSLRGKSDQAAFLATFSGTHRFVLEYLTEEVLARQPEPVQTFLLHTCLLERLSASLCDAVTQQEGSQARLEALDKANLFVVALDDERGWYRYHHLFAQMLRQHLAQREPALVPTLHRRAGAWYEQHAMPAEAIGHALAVPDPARAARLIEPLALPAAFQGKIFVVLGWLDALPEALMATSPSLCTCHAILLIFANRPDAAEARIQSAEKRLEQDLPAEQARSVRGQVLAARAVLAFFAGDLPAAVSLAGQALALLPETAAIMRAAAMVVRTSGYMVSGDVTLPVEHEVAAAVAVARRAGDFRGTLALMCMQARLHILQGRRRQAAATFSQVLQAFPQTAEVYTKLSSLCYHFGRADLPREENELEVAEQYLMQAMQLIQETQGVEGWVAVLGYIALARVQHARGNTDAAAATLDAFVHLARQRHFAPPVQRQIAAVRAQLDLALGNLTAAICWADTCGLSLLDSELPYPRESEYLILARVRLAQGRSDPDTRSFQDVLTLLDRLHRDAESKARLGSVLEILMLRALALSAQGQHPAALTTLDHALALAEPEGYLRLFLDEGAPMLALLRRARAHSALPRYVATLLTAFGEASATESAGRTAGALELPEPLTKREREILRLLLQGASNRDIAATLLLSVNTVKRHIYNLCGKLGVQSRAQAIARARNLPLE